MVTIYYHWHCSVVTNGHISVARFYADGGGDDVRWCKDQLTDDWLNSLLSCVAEHRAEGGSRELEAGAPRETAAFGQSPVSPHILIIIIYQCEILTFSLNKLKVSQFVSEC